MGETGKDLSHPECAASLGPGRVLGDPHFGGVYTISLEDERRIILHVDPIIKHLLLHILYGVG